MEVPVEPPGKKPFKLVRYFSATSAIALVLVIAALVFLYRHFAVSGIIELAERQNEFLARSVSRAIWPRYGGYLVSVGELDADALRARPEVAGLNASLKALSRDLPIIKVRVYTLEGRTVFSTDAREMGERMGSHVRTYLASKEGREGKPLTFLGKKEKFGSISGPLFRRVIAESYVPVRLNQVTYDSVFEMYMDVTHMMGRIDSNMINFLAGLSLAFGALYAGLFLIVRRADGILKTQYTELNEERIRLAASLAELQRAQKMIVRAERLSAIGTLTAGADHEILNPANIIGLHAQRMLEESEKRGEKHESAEVIVRNVGRITRICGDLRRFSQSEKQDKTLFSPNQVVRNSLLPLKAELDLCNIETCLDLREEEPVVVGDRLQLQRVLVNLLKNAMDAMPEGGTLTISSQEVAENGRTWWEIRMADTGEGIPPDILPSIFDPFFTTKAVDEGTGLGLSVSYGIIESHGGKIWAERKPENGATFFVRLPVLGRKESEGS